MIKKHNLSGWRYAISFLVVLTLASCKNSTSASSAASTYGITNLVSDTTAEFPGTRSDVNLVNAWGMATDASGNFYISANNGGVAVVYDHNGNLAHAPITIPSPTGSTGGTPNGVVVNTSTDFNANAVIFSTEDGIIAAWKTGSAATVAVDNSASNTVYKGLAMATSGGKNYLYATDFHNAKIDVFDKSFNKVTLPGTFTDGAIPSNFAPFGIATIGGQLYVTYSRQKVGKHDDSSDVGIGYVDIYNADGTFASRFASQGTLNSPWGITEASAGFGDFKNDIIVGNFGDGTFNAYDGQGNFKGQLKDQNGYILNVGKGLWGILFTAAGGNPNLLYFASGPNDEGHGLFGYVQLK